MSTPQRQVFVPGGRVTGIAQRVMRQLEGGVIDEEVGDVRLVGGADSPEAERYVKQYEGEFLHEDELAVRIGSPMELSLDGGAYPLADLYYWLAGLADGGRGNGTLLVAARWVQNEDGAGVQMMEQFDPDEDTEVEEE